MSTFNKVYDDDDDDDDVGASKFIFFECYKTGNRRNTNICYVTEHVFTLSIKATKYYSHSKLLSVQLCFQTYSSKVARILYCSGQGRSQGGPCPPPSQNPATPTAGFGTSTNAPTSSERLPALILAVVLYYSGYSIFVTGNAS